MECEKLELTQEWDKVFPKRDDVDHEKVTFVNRYGITLAADLYKPKGEAGKFAAIAVSGPFGAVKEQVSGLYAQELAARGFLTIAFDPSFTGESGGHPRFMSSPDINTEDFQAAVDFLSCHDEVDPERIGILGVCGWGGMALNAASIDTRIKATVTSTMYNMTRINAKGYYDEADNADARGYHPRSPGSNDGWNVIGCMSFISQPIIAYSDEIRTPILMIHGENAHSRYFSEDEFAKLTGDNKELVIIPGAVHTDLYYNVDVIPFDKIEEFYNKCL